MLTQVGGIAFLISEVLRKRINWNGKFKSIGSFFIIYGLITFLFVPLIAPIFGREKVKHNKKIKPTNYMTVILNRNYVRPALNKLLLNTGKNLEGSEIKINYLDANFPFINKFPLLPHLSHNDGKKIDISFIYETKQGEITNKQKSVSGYGLFEAPKSNESDQIQKCLSQGYFQYDFAKYLRFGTTNKALQFSERGTKELILGLLDNSTLGKMFIEPHLKERLKLQNKKIRYHGCRAVRHDDHIHIQLK